MNKYLNALGYACALGTLIVVWATYWYWAIFPTFELPMETNPFVFVVEFILIAYAIYWVAIKFKDLKIKK